MATYYKYAERSADSQINWAEVGKSMSDMLKEETRIREEKKAAIDAASRDFGNTLANPPQGEHKGANQWALEYGDNASQFMLMQDRLLKSGQMKLKDYTIARQNLLDGTDHAFNLAKDYQAVFAEKMERYKTDKSQDLEQWLMAQAEGYSDFNKSQLYINPTDGSVSVAMKEKKNINGKDVYAMSTNPNQFTSINTLRNQIAGKYDKFDTNAVTEAFAKGLGDEMKAVQTEIATKTKQGQILSIEDITSRTDIDPDTKKVMFKFIDAENQMIDGALANPYNRLSVLTNSKKFAPNGKQYTFTQDEAEAKANPDKILLKVDPSSGQPTPQFSEEQKKVSQDFMRNEARAKYDYKEKIDTTSTIPYGPQAQQWQYAAGQEKKDTMAAAGAWNQLYTGKTAAAKRDAADILLGTPNAQAQGLLEIDLESKPGSVVLKYSDSKRNRTIPMQGSTLFDFAGKGVELHGVVDRQQAVKAGGGGTGYGAITDWKGVKSSREGTQPQDNPEVAFSNKVNAIPSSLFNNQNNKKATQELVKYLQGVGATVKPASFSNDIEVSYGGKTITINSNENAANAEVQKNNLVNFLETTVPITAKQGLLNKQTKGVGAKYN